MGTRATVIIKEGENKRYLYHYWDGYGLDYDLDKILKSLTDDKWSIDEIVEFDEAYAIHKVDDIGWDSEYAYVIDIDNRTLKKYGCGLWFNDEHTEENMSIEEGKTQEKYLEESYDYNRKDSTSEKASEIVNFAYKIADMINYFGESIGFTKEDREKVVEILFGIYHGDSSV